MDYDCGFAKILVNPYNLYFQIFGMLERNSMHAIRNGRIVLNDKILDGCALLFDRKIIGIVSRETKMLAG